LGCELLCEALTKVQNQKYYAQRIATIDLVISMQTEEQILSTGVEQFSEERKFAQPDSPEMLTFVL
jgi:hypothetical protein